MLEQLLGLCPASVLGHHAVVLGAKAGSKALRPLPFGAPRHCEEASQNKNRGSRDEYDDCMLAHIDLQPPSGSMNPSPAGASLLYPVSLEKVTRVISSLGCSEFSDEPKGSNLCAVLLSCISMACSQLKGWLANCFKAEVTVQDSAPGCRAFADAIVSSGWESNPKRRRTYCHVG